MQFGCSAVSPPHCTLLLLLLTISHPQVSLSCTASAGRDLNPSPQERRSGLKLTWAPAEGSLRKRFESITVGGPPRELSAHSCCLAFPEYAP